MTEVPRERNFLPEILEQIFHHLNIRSLSRASAVCKLWNKIATHELKNRGPQRILISDSHEDVYNSIGIKPQVTLLFVGSVRMTNTRFAMNEQNIHLDILINYKNYFPCHLVAVKAYILMMDEQIINYNSQSQCNFLSLLIPQRRDLKIRVANSQLFNHDHMKFINNILPEDLYEKATIILFMQGPNINFNVLEMIQESMKQRNQKYSLWGMAACCTPLTAVNGQVDESIGKVSSTKHQIEQENSDSLFAMSITGSSLESSSIVISCIAKKDEFNRKLLDFRDQLRFKRHSIGLISGPCDVMNLLDIEGLNSTNMHGDYKELMSAVKSVFPDVPFIGMYDATFACYYGRETKTTGGFYHNVQNSMSVSLMILTFD